jgi:hypothetical protein
VGANVVEIVDVGVVGANECPQGTRFAPPAVTLEV